MVKPTRNKLFANLSDDCVNCPVLRNMLTVWYCNQVCYVRWRTVIPYPRISHERRHSAGWNSISIIS